VITVAKVHILEGSGYQYQIVVHFPVPEGNNSAGISWKSCLLASHPPTPVLPVGIGPGTITQDEYDDIMAGDVLEIVRTISVGTTPTNAAVVELADKDIAEYLSGLASVLKYYGHTIVVE
jgi:hypothetical protein